MDKKPPVRKDQEIHLHIEGLNHEGEGVGRFEGFTVFIPGTVPGDTVSACVISLQKTYARALLRKLVNPSPCRVVPDCVHHEDCGGCQLQHLAYPEQLRQKQTIVRETLLRVGGLDLPVLPVLGMPEPWRYRNKAQVPFGSEDGTIKAGFFARRSHSIVDLDRCPIQHPANDQAVAAVRSALAATGISAYNEKEHRGLLRHVLARTSLAGGETLVVLVTNGRHLPQKEALIEAIRSRLPGLAGIVQNINTRRGNTILGPQEITLCGRPYITEQLDGLSFRISARSFFQVNTAQTKVLYDKVAEYAALTGKETVFDLYCGTGTIALYLARRAHKVIGVESVPQSITDAGENARLNNIKNAEFHAGPAEEVVPALYQKGYSANVVVLDPPRKGCDRKLLDTIAAMQPERVVYVSCNPATLARDLKHLTQCGYVPQEVQPVDMFPHTSHVETVVLMSRVGE
jgi:23S rRNA (uracil1939-C5)-methyltransferase